MPSLESVSLPQRRTSGPAPSCGQYIAAHSHRPLLQVKMAISFLSHRIHLGFCCTARSSVALRPCHAARPRASRVRDSVNPRATATQSLAAGQKLSVDQVTSQGARASLWVGSKVKAEPVRCWDGVYTRGRTSASPSSSVRPRAPNAP